MKPFCTAASNWESCWGRTPPPHPLTPNTHTELSYCAAGVCLSAEIIRCELVGGAPERSWRRAVSGLEGSQGSQPTLKPWICDVGRWHSRPNRWTVMETSCLSSFLSSAYLSIDVLALEKINLDVCSHSHLDQIRPGLDSGFCPRVQK